MSQRRTSYVDTTLEFPPLLNDNILRVAWGLKPTRRPMWIMRQAGRYLPEFQELREEHSFFDICEYPALACTATLMPIQRFDLDAAIIFSDILVIPKALGLKVEMRSGVGPVLPEPLTLTGMKNLRPPELAIEELRYVGQAITLARYKLAGRVPLFGFAGGPWTLMAYMIEGGGSKTFSKPKKWLYAHPKEAHELLALLANLIVDFFILQIDYGAQVLQVFESCAEVLDKDLFTTFCVPYLKYIRGEVRALRNIPMFLFAKGAWFALEEQASLGYEVISIDWTTDPQHAVRAMPNVGLQGNLDPCALYAPEAELRERVRKMLSLFPSSRHIVNLGHGIYPDTPVEAVEVFIDEVRTSSAK